MAYSADQAYELVAAAHRRGRLAHALLISGPPGSGKEDLAARVVSLVAGGGQESAGLGLWGEDVVPVPKPLDEWESGRVHILRPHMKSRRIGIKEIRSMEHLLHLACEANEWKVGVIVDADRMGTAAANAFLKTLEEPPPRTLILLLTEMPESLLSTIRSRCVKLPLTGGGLAVDNYGRKVLDVLDRLGIKAVGNPRGVLTMRAAVSAVLAVAKEEIAAQEKELRDQEIEHYKNSTEAAEWLEDRADMHDAAVQSEYLRVRTRTIDLLASWLGDVARQKAGFAELDFPQSAAVTAELAVRHSWPDLLRRADAIEELKRTLETNAQEQLAMEVGFLRAFG